MVLLLGDLQPSPGGHQGTISLDCDIEVVHSAAALFSLVPTPDGDTRQMAGGSLVEGTKTAVHSAIESPFMGGLLNWAE